VEVLLRRSHVAAPEKRHEGGSNKKIGGREMEGITIARMAKVKFVDPRVIVGPSISVPIWIWRKEIKMGGLTSSQLLSAMNVTGEIDVGRYAKNIMQDPAFVISPGKRIINLACCEISDLGFTKQPTTSELWARFKEIKGLCPADTGPYLRYQFLDQPVDDWAFVAMEPISMTLISRGVFLLGCSRSNNGHSNKKLWIEGCAVGENARWGLKLKFIIVC